MNQPAVAASWRGRRRLALAGLIVSIACLASGLVLAVINLRSPGAPPLDGNGVSGAFMALTYGGIGWLVASRQPQNAVGWILMTVGLAEAVETFTSSAAVHGQITAPGSIPYADILVWLALWAWVPG